MDGGVIVHFPCPGRRAARGIPASNLRRKKIGKSVQLFGVLERMIPNFVREFTDRAGFRIFFNVTG
jgi:hypothetical protein